MESINLIETMHPRRQAEKEYNELVGLDSHKKNLLGILSLLLDRERLSKWAKKHHNNKLSLLDRFSGNSLVILHGEVGCGKTALAASIATPFAKELDERLICFETPSDIRGTGRVGEISARITAAFSQAKAKVKNYKGLLIIDEADDLATSRSQMQAHHEDRAGLNVLIKQIDQLNREQISLVVILITNRINVLDPAVIRRAALVLKFDRPNDEIRRILFEKILSETKYKLTDIDKLVKDSNTEIPYSFSDLTQRITHTAICRAFQTDTPFGPEIYHEVLKQTEPSPLLETKK